MSRIAKKTPPTILIYFLLAGQSFSQSIHVTKYFEWFSKNHIINDPSFAHADSEIVFSIQFNIPDGGNAFGREKYVQGLLERAKKERRFADPIVTILNLNTRKITPIDYGWGPCFSPDDKSIVYAFQTMPISGFRTCEETTRGNKIQLYNCDTKKIEILVAPKTNHFLEPQFFDKNHIVFDAGRAVNGAYGGAAGINILNLASKKVEVILAPEIKYGNYAFVGNTYCWRNELAYSIAEPKDSFTYRYFLVTEGQRKLQMGEGYLKDLGDKVVLNKNHEIIYLDDDHTWNYEVNYLVYFQNGKEVSRRPIKFEYHKAYLSPDGEYMFYDDYDSHFYLVALKTFNRARIDLPDREIHCVSWSTDCKKFAVVQDHEVYGDTDIIRLFKIK